MPTGLAQQPLLFTPMKLRGLTLKNRIVVSPMCQYQAVDGAMTDWHFAHLSSFAIGGAGIVFTEETAVERRGRKTYGCSGLWKNAQIAPLQRVADFVTSQGAVPAIQLGHSGRKAAIKRPLDGYTPLDKGDAARGEPAWTPISSSASPAGEAAQTAHALTRSEIRKVQDGWLAAVRRARKAGFQIVEVHGAHGYLIHQFLSPLANARTDEYGGDLKGRMRFALEVAELTRAAWPDDWPVFFRVSAMDGSGPHWRIEDTVTLARALKEIGIDLVVCSSGGIRGPLTMPVVKRKPGYQVPFAARVRRDAHIKTMAIGLITRPQQAERILRQGKADLIALARELMYNPHWPLHAALALGAEQGFQVAPDYYAWWLERREKVRELARRG